MEINDIIQGFQVRRCRPLPELEARLWEMEHQETGARLCWLEREESNKTFSITFRTVPEDDTGVFHILEHSVLCGSERFPLKEPFLDMLKNSMQTFLNAFTYPDHTMYPVSSRNDKDFLHLMEVYLDAVFRPRLLPEVFRQEGWHWEVNGEQVVRTGVVLNEMRGALSDPESLLINAINRSLYPDNCYRFESGGEPSHIPDLTWEKFVETHRRFYHPSNSWIFLDGTMDLPAVLALIARYLDGQGRETTDTSIPLQAPVHPAPVREPYPLAAGTDPEGRTWMAFASVLGDFSRREERIGMEILTDVLCGSNESPLKAAILQAGLAEEVSMYILDSTAQPALVLEARNLKEERTAELQRVVETELKRLCEEGLDRGQVEAALASEEFSRRERDFGSLPMGIGLGISAMEGWLFGGDPLEHLETDRLFRSLRARLEEPGWYENLLRSLTIDNPHRCEVILTPSATLEAEKLQAEQASILANPEACGPERREIILREQEALHAWQETPDTPEQKATLPRLELSDVSPEPTEIPMEVGDLDGTPRILHRIPNSGIGCFTISFEVTDVSADTLPRLALLARLCGNLETEQHSAVEIKRLSRLYLNGLSIGVESGGFNNDPARCRLFFSLTFRTLESCLPEAMDLAVEILTSTRLEDRGKILDLIRQTRVLGEQRMVENGHSLAIGRVTASASVDCAAREYCSGLTGYLWTKDLEKNWSDQADAMLDSLKNLRGQIMTTGRLFLRCTGLPTEAWDSILREKVIARLPVTERRPLVCTLELMPIRKEGVRVAADVAFTARGGVLTPITGMTRILGRVLSLDYLWNAVRVKGGAYGTGATLVQSGACALYSFRDPDAGRTLKAYDGMRAYLENFCAQKPDLTGYLIGAISDTEPLLPPWRQGIVADGWYFGGVTLEDRRRVRKEMLETTVDDLLPAFEPMEDALNAGGLCVVGGEKYLKAVEDSLESIQSV